MKTNYETIISCSYYMHLFNPSSPQTAGAGHVWRHWGAGQCEMGAGFVSSGLLGVLLLQYLERCQIFWKGAVDILSVICNFFPQQLSFYLIINNLKLLLLFSNSFLFIPGCIFHSHVSLCDAPDPPHQRLDSTWSWGRNLLLPVSRPEPPR